MDTVYSLFCAFSGTDILSPICHFGESCKNGNTPGSEASGLLPPNVNVITFAS